MLPIRKHSMATAHVHNRTLFSEIYHNCHFHSTVPPDTRARVDSIRLTEWKRDRPPWKEIQSNLDASSISRVSTTIWSVGVELQTTRAAELGHVLSCRAPTCSLHPHTRLHRREWLNVDMTSFAIREVDDGAGRQRYLHWNVMLSWTSNCACWLVSGGISNNVVNASWETRIGLESMAAAQV
jgi:hypothetical protein